MILAQTKTIPTRGENILDVFLTNRSFLIQKCKAVPGVNDLEKCVYGGQHKCNQNQRKVLLWKHVDTVEQKPGVLDFSTRFATQCSTSTGVNKQRDTLKDFLFAFLKIVSL